ncbi:MAG: hypothetical protein ACOYM3_01270 [Terrimicrobiaceae bacterium]
MNLYWNPETTPPACSLLLAELSEEYPLFSGAVPAGGCGLRVEFQTGTAGIEVSRESGGFVICCGSLNGLGRGVGTILSGLCNDGESTKETLPFDSFGVMLDMSRNAVMRPDHLRRWMRRLCLFGFNRLMLYMEDTYKLPDEPYFGYLRGGYPAEELRQIDSWGEALGIELSGCVQALGHLEQVLKWPAYSPVRDTPSVLLAGDGATYELIEKMVSTMAENLSSRTLHIGFDEAHDLGRGKFLDTHGYQPPFDIYVRHLQRVCEICARHGIQAQIWSDMVFRLGSATGDYYDRASVVPPGVIEALPAGVGMVYWDYYGLMEDHYRYWLNRHKELGVPVSVASSVWTWMAPWYDRGFTEATVGPCVSACRGTGVRDITFTLWGDDGAYCELDSALAGLAFAAECGWCADGSAKNGLEARFEAVCGVPYSHAVLPCEMEIARPGSGVPLDQNGYLSDGIGPVLWDDPLYLMIRKNRASLPENGGVDYWKTFARHQETVFQKLEALPAHEGMIDLRHARNITNVLRRKVRLANEMESAYRTGDRAALRAAAEDIPHVIAAIGNLQASFRRQWLRRNRPHGLETMQIRLAGLTERYHELARRLEEYLGARADAIPEWDESAGLPAGGLVQWRRIASPGIL